MSVFVSFDKRDTDKGNEIIAACKAAGVAIWQPDGVDDQNFVLKRRGAISGADAFIAVVSPGYASSVLCVNELKLATRSNVKRIAVILNNDPAVDALIAASGFHSVTRAGEPVERLITDLRGLGLARTETPAAAPSPPPAAPAGVLQPVPARAPIIRSGPRDEAGRFFINFSGTDRDPVGYLRGALKENGIQYWDFQQGNRDLQQPLASEIEEAIQTSVGMLSIVTNRWRDSQWVLREYLYAREVGLPNFLLLFEKIRLTLVISERTFIDFTADRAAGIAQLAREIAEIRS
jgi:TIR domain